MAKDINLVFMFQGKLFTEEKHIPQIDQKKTFIIPPTRKKHFVVKIMFFGCLLYQLKNTKLLTQLCQQRKQLNHAHGHPSSILDNGEDQKWRGFLNKKTDDAVLRKTSSEMDVAAWCNNQRDRLGWIGYLCVG